MRWEPAPYLAQASSNLSGAVTHSVLCPLKARPTSGAAFRTQLARLPPSASVKVLCR